MTPNLPGECWWPFEDTIGVICWVTWMSAQVFRCPEGYWRAIMGPWRGGAGLQH